MLSYKYLVWVPVGITFLIVMTVSTHAAVFRPTNEVSFLDVGQGDSILILTGAGDRTLIDCGPSPGILGESLQEKLGTLGKRIDLLVITHGDSDHYGGCVGILDRYSIGRVLINGVVDPENESYKSFISDLQSRVPVLPAIEGMSIELTPEVKMTVLNPPPGTWGTEKKDDNSDSVVIDMQTETKRFLLTGDIPEEQEKRILQTYPELDTDVLKAGHHGSKTSTSELWLDKVTPETIVISAGKDNRYGHPHQEVLERITSRNIDLLTTQNSLSIDISF